jgi:predicted phosphodiesterase
MMKNNCFGFCCSLGCLFIALIISLFFYFLYDFHSIDRSNILEPIPEDQANETVLKILIASDTESDFESIDYFAKSAVVDEHPDLTVFIGDLTSLGVIDEFSKIDQIFSPNSGNILFVPGDRDLWKSNGVTNFKKIFGENYYFKEVNGFGLLFIDNADEYRGIDPNQFAFIKENIDRTDFVFLHNPIYFDTSLLGIIKKGMGRYSQDVEKQRIELLHIIEKSKVKAVFAGDQHLFNHYPDNDKKGLDFFIIGALAQSRNLDQPNYAILTVSKDGSYNVEKRYLRPSN